MNEEKKSKRQERREKAQQKERANRLRTMGLIVAGVAILVFLFISQQLKPVTGIVTVASEPRPSADRNSMGDPNAPIQIIEYGDYQCPFCERFATDTEPLLAEFFVKTGKIRFTYRSAGNWVSSGAQAPNTESQDSAAAAYCAADQGKFWEMQDTLFANVLGEDVGSFTDRRLQAIAEKVGLDMTEFNSCYNSSKYADQIQQDFTDGTAAGVTGTPGFLITYASNGETKTKTLSGAQPFSTFQQELEAILVEIGAQ